MKIAILGGTFNPIHIGHTTMAEYVLSNMGMDRICFLPNGQPPHKSDDLITNKKHRLAMVTLATRMNPHFYVSDYEITRDEKCYTVDTIKYFKSLGDDEYYFIIGADSLFQLDTWKNPDELKRICSFIVCDRSKQGDTEAEVARLRAEGCNILLADMERIDIDSTTIRQRIRSGADISGYVNEDVAQYIYRNELYR